MRLGIDLNDRDTTDVLSEDDRVKEEEDKVMDRHHEATFYDFDDDQAQPSSHGTFVSRLLRVTLIYYRQQCSAQDFEGSVGRTP